ncbi:type IV secretory pathway VirJ component [Novosphingobium chloroacetimidivorans]|uniref:Type IV secretory pathway VirJ component n=1 Tax=Novosphingobium chloroacetimidivorans TaxID=1428314 RepID=A0A7W7KES5_9SPHN|nr:virulence factor [Novosphingobium chloroacetimidivorans]MBB4860919.1 type IV secretory pathway VirJ component [Novosphingobium chloroacetimidivorans]
MNRWQSTRALGLRTRGDMARRTRRIVGWTALLLGVLMVIAAAAPILRLFGTSPYLIYRPQHQRIPLAAVMLSGDIGFRGGMSAPVAAALADRGMTVVGVSSPVVFAFHHTQAEAVAVVQQAIRSAMRISGADKVVLVGQSYGGDIVATTAPHLGANLLAHVAAIDLLVPGRNVYFRADPTGLAYYFTPDAHPAAALRALKGPPLACIYGIEETDSLCPLMGGAARVMALPGNHHLNHDHVALVKAAMSALHQMVPIIRS